MQNTVELIGHYGSDLIHAQSAWTSTSRDLTQEKLDRVPKLLEYLATNAHHTPFEKSLFHFLITCDNATHIHLLKHRIGVSINGESARYKEMVEDKIYIPEDFKRVKCTYLVDDKLNPENFTWYDMLEKYSKLGNSLYHACLNDCTDILGRKRAKESSRFFKTLNNQITMDVSFNMRSFYHFYNLRAKDNAQDEVRDIAIKMLNCIKSIENNPFKHTLEAFNL